MRAGTNPGGPGHDWVHNRFIQTWVEHGKTNPPNAQRHFYPATIADNRHLDGATYRQNLELLDPITRAQLRDGDWDIRPAGRMFRPEWFEIIDPAHIPESCNWVRFWDLAATAKTPDNDPDYTVGALVGYDHHTKSYFITDIQRLRDTSGVVERHVRRIAEHDGQSVPIYIEEEPGSSGKIAIDQYRRTVLNGWSVRGDRPTGAKIVRAEPFSARAEHGEVKLARGTWNQTFLDETVQFPDGRHDDQVDAVAGAMSVLSTRPHYNITLPVDEFTRENHWKIY
jgi:predicted phage terminase large subunit-like protein